MIEATATTNTQENPLILSHLESIPVNEIMRGHRAALRG